MSLPEISTDRDWLEAYLDNGLLPAEREKLEKRLCLEDDLADLLVSIVNYEAVIQEWAALQATSSWSWSFQMPSRSSIRSLLLPAAKFIAAGLLLLTVTAASWVGIYYLAAPLFNKAPSTPIVTPTTLTTKSIAVVKMIFEGELRSQEILFVVNDPLKMNQQYHLEKGLLELEMNSGVKVVIEGPSTFQLLGLNNLRLLQGTITANVPHNAIGFTVNTPTIKVIDLGTQFGVHVNKEGTSEAHVFKGIVDCFAAEGEKTISSAKRLVKGESSKRQVGGELVQSDTKSEELFATCLRQQAGIKSLSGDIKFLPQMPASLGLCDFTDNNFMHLFVEQQELVLPKDVTCSVPVQNRPGRANEKQFKSGIIKKGTKVNVYFIHFDAHCFGHPNFSTEKTFFAAECSMVFKNKVLGILQTDGQLLRTDPFLGNPGTRYINDKTGQPGQPNVNRGADDTIRLPLDDRGINLNWNLSRKRIIGADSMRVIVATQK